jgi:hypothetical protein
MCHLTAQPPCLGESDDDLLARMRPSGIEEPFLQIMTKYAYYWQNVKHCPQKLLLQKQNPQHLGDVGMC